MQHIVNRAQFGVEHEDAKEDLSSPKTDYVAFGVLQPVLAVNLRIAPKLGWVALNELQEEYG